MSYQTTIDAIERESQRIAQAVADGEMTGLHAMTLEPELEKRRRRAAARRGMRAQQSKEEQVGIDCGQSGHNQPCWCGCGEGGRNEKANDEAVRLKT